MSIHDIIESGANVTIAVSASDLRDFARKIVEETRQELVREIAEEKSEVYYSVDQVMSILNVSKMTLWRWNKKDDFLHPIKVGGLLRYRKSDVDKILKK